MYDLYEITVNGDLIGDHDINEVTKILYDLEPDDHVEIKRL